MPPGMLSGPVVCRYAARSSTAGRRATDRSAFVPARARIADVSRHISIIFYGWKQNQELPLEITVKLFTNGRSQAVRIPKAYRFEGVDDVILRKEGDALIVTPAQEPDFLDAEAKARAALGDRAQNA